MLVSSLELLLAILFEILRAEPPLIIHPTVWFGKIVSYLDRKLPPSILAGLIPPFSTVILAIFLSKIPEIFPFPLNLILSSYLLYTTISIKSMIEHASSCISGNRILANRVQMIVSRDTRNLNEHQLCSAVIESVSENFVDGVLSPLFYFSLFGLKGALIYKAVNTCDAMLGYRKGKYEKFGKISARLDDILNYLPSRISLIFYAFLSKKAFICGIKKNPKLNGNSISAMAGLLSVTLEKTGEYSIDCGKKPEINDVLKSLKYFKLFSIAAVISAVLLKLMG